MRIRLTVIAMAVLAILIFSFAPAKLPFNLPLSFQSPTFSHPFGFDSFGRDLFLILLQAMRRSLVFALTASVASVLISVILGIAIASATHRFQSLALRGLEFLLGFPSILFALAWAAIRGPGWDTLFFALWIGTVPVLTRLVFLRSQEVLIEDYVTAARSLGAGHLWVARKHLTPAVLGLILTKSPNLIAQAILAEATLTFLGIGVPIGHESWGSLLIQSKDYLLEAPHIAIATGLPLIFLVLALQILSEEVS